MALKIICIVGPTATGKSELAVKLALKFNGEIINADSRQFYKEMKIGTAKPDNEMLGRVRHHLINCTSINQPWTVADFVKEAKESIDQIGAEGKLPIVAGGTGMYIKSLLFGLDEIPQVKKEIIKELSDKLEKKGLLYLYHQLKSVDPEAAKRISENDRQRILRALGIYKQTGRQIHHFWKRNNQTSKYDYIKIAASVKREVLYDRINHRVKEMFKTGLKQEFLTLKEKHTNNEVLQKTIGYAEWYDKGDESEECVLEAIQKNTRHFAKRQLTWFKNETDVVWVDFFDVLAVERLVEDFVNK